MYYVWFSGSAVVFCAQQPKQRLLNDVVILEMYNKVIDMAIETPLTFLFTRTQTPRIFLEAQ